MPHYERVEGDRTGTVIVLFTDLVASTQLRSRLGDLAADALRREHDDALRTVTERHGGSQVKGTGDGVLAVFPAAAGAVAAAVDMQAAIARLGRRTGQPLAIRTGLSAGDVSWDGDDCFGTPVVEAARLCHAAAGGEILVADVVRVLAGSRTPHGFQPRGQLELPGLPMPVSAYAVSAAPTAARIPLPSALSYSDADPFVGRLEERQRLERLWEEVAHGRRQVVLLSGEPGAGKTRLAAELARTAHESGAAVLLGRCDEEIGVPYEPFLEALRPYLESCPAEDVEPALQAYGGDLAVMLPSIRSRWPSLPEAVRADPDTERRHLFDGVAAIMKSATDAAPVLLVLDDLHWAAKSTLLMLRHLLRSTAELPLLVVGTYRDTDLDRRHPLADLLADLRREARAERLPVRGLTASDVVTLLADIRGQALDAEESEIAAAVHAETDGNPFFVGQVLHHIAESRPKGGRIAIPEGVREVVGRRLTRLPESANDVLAAAAVIGRTFDASVLADSTEMPVDSVLDALEKAEQARLIAPLSDRVGGYEFVHALVRSTLYDELSTARRLRLHRRIAAALATRADAEQRIEELAHHACEAAALGDGSAAADYSEQAGRRAMDRLAFEEAIRIYQRALDVLEATSLALERCQLQIGLGHALRAIGELDACRQALDQAFESALALGLPDVAAEAALTRAGRRGWPGAGVVDRVQIGQFERVLPLLSTEDSPRRAMVLSRLAADLYFQREDSARREALTTEALAMAERLDDPATMAFTLVCCHWGLLRPGTAPERLAIAEKVSEIARDLGDLEYAHLSLIMAASDLIELGDSAAAAERLAAAEEVTSRLHQPEYDFMTLTLKGTLLLMTGRIGEVQQLAERTLAIGQSVDAGTALQFYGVVQIELARLRGGMEDLVPLIAPMVEEFPLVPAWRTGLMTTLRRLDRREEVRRHFDVLAADDFASLPFDGNWLIGMCLIADACYYLGDAARAAQIYDILAPYAEFVVPIGAPAATLGAVWLMLAELAACREEWSIFEDHAERALAANARAQQLPWLAETKSTIAEVLLRRNLPGDRDRATALIAEAVDTARALGWPAVVERLERMRAVARPTEKTP